MRTNKWQNINFTCFKPSVLGLSTSRLFVGEQLHARLWHAVCEYSGDVVKPNITWILPDDDNIVKPTVRSTYRGINVQVNSTFEFQLSQYEGKDLICVIQNKHGKDERQTTRVPKYCKETYLLAI